MLRTLSEQERQAVEYYDYEIRERILWDTQIWLDDFMHSIFWRLAESGGTVIDVGCNMGRAIPLFEQMGVKGYFGIDPSVESVKYCRENFPKYSFEEDEIRTIGENYPNRFGGFFLACVLMHLPRKDMAVAIKSLRVSLKAGSPGMFSTPAGKTETDEVENKSGMKLTLLTPEEVYGFFAQNGFEVSSLEVVAGMLLGHVVAV